MPDRGRLARIIQKTWLVLFRANPPTHSSFEELFAGGTPAVRCPTNSVDICSRFVHIRELGFEIGASRLAKRHRVIMCRAIEWLSGRSPIVVGRSLFEESSPVIFAEQGEFRGFYRWLCHGRRGKEHADNRGNNRPGTGDITGKEQATFALLRGDKVLNHMNFTASPNFFTHLWEGIGVQPGGEPVGWRL
jgi:hypothetical protein